MKKIVALLLALVLCLSLCACGGSRGGDGVNTCRNCGRNKKLVPGFGFCDTCYEGFVDWQEDNWKDN